MVKKCQYIFVKTDSQWFMDHQQGGSNFTLRHFFDIFIQERG